MATAAWTRKEGKSKSGGLNKKGIASYRRANPGSKLSMAVTTKPSKLKKGSKAANRRKSFCARMGGMKGPMKDEKGRPTRKALSLRKWNCKDGCTVPGVVRKYVRGGTTKDACYNKVVSRYGPKTSAYRSGAMAKCRKVGVSNWGEGGKKKK